MRDVTTTQCILLLVLVCNSVAPSQTYASSQCVSQTPNRIGQVPRAKHPEDTAFVAFKTVVHKDDTARFFLKISVDATTLSAEAVYQVLVRACVWTEVRKRCGTAALPFDVDCGIAFIKEDLVDGILELSLGSNALAERTYVIFTIFFDTFPGMAHDDRLLAIRQHNFDCCSIASSLFVRSNDAHPLLPPPPPPASPTPPPPPPPAPRRTTCSNVQIIFQEPLHNSMIRVDTSLRVLLFVPEQALLAEIDIETASIELRLFNTVNTRTTNSHAFDIGGRWMNEGNASMSHLLKTRGFMWASVPLGLNTQNSMRLSARLHFDLSAHPGFALHATNSGDSSMCEVASEIHVHVMDDLINIESVSHRRSRMGTPVEFILEFYVRIVAPASRGGACASPTIELEVGGVTVNKTIITPGVSRQMHEERGMLTYALLPHSPPLVRMPSSIRVYLFCPHKGQRRKGNDADDVLEHLPTWMHETTVLFDQAAQHIPDGRRQPEGLTTHTPQNEGYVPEANVEHPLGHRPVERYSSIHCTGGLHGHEGWPQEYRPFTSHIPWDGNGVCMLQNVCWHDGELEYYHDIHELHDVGVIESQAAHPDVVLDNTVLTLESRDFFNIHLLFESGIVKTPPVEAKRHAQRGKGMNKRYNPL